MRGDEISMGKRVLFDIEGKRVLVSSKACMYSCMHVFMYSCIHVSLRYSCVVLVYL